MKTLQPHNRFNIINNKIIMKKIYQIIIAISIGSFFFISCEKDPSTPPTPEIKTADEINTFIWSGLHDYYLWTKNVPNLNKSYYTPNSDSLNQFLNKYTDHEKLFYDLLYDYGHTDKFSWIVDDYEVLEKEFEGITKSMGYNFMLGRYATGDKVFGYVRYVVKGSPAAIAGIKRGDLFTQVNNQDITVTNYMDLLVNSEAYTLNFVDLINTTLTPNGKTATMTAIEIAENPIFLDTVYTINNQKIGYLVYNSFTSTYDKELNNVMLKFKNEGINKLILDLRYNGGGSVQTATYLASMIYGINTTKIFLKTEYNDVLHEYLNQEYGSDYFDVKFESLIYGENDNNTAINTLNLPAIHIITSDNTASASESIIVGLKPYITVTTVGTNTYGKYVGSITLKDYIDDKGTVNPKHKWAMQPIVLKIASSTGYSDYVDGLAPNVTIEEEITNMSVLGDLNEPLLNATISNITGISTKSKAFSNFSYKLLTKSEDFHKKEMYYNNPKIMFNLKK